MVVAGDFVDLSPAVDQSAADGGHAWLWTISRVRDMVVAVARVDEVGGVATICGSERLVPCTKDIGSRVGVSESSDLVKLALE